ncbi:MAG: hypothetical protein A3I07_01550 [Candidatus Doudnabacteria bacterium RIFCSPLOWO2_02_FULL_42_9]|uniref:Uncharacterized protein n=1 Tax=Candidatus Doudnabacteria bacterium RIFCSPHIGHO2_01_FULL_41_86 TaxID=1817821 RepID=A0A1F5N916_9BACT|nr:MAG: hypothetical protein A2717_01290 [Candidatus Doudnabacteria bacterium RIFCSPHIGHO2_01_FULL_41_86]OGE74859.1 MAG: hypothetical protein A3K07_02860 [Candidatus Doudnabacteria bacterium RIFCSPHIGHO2_01_43_10]OGE85204.1 MAG: hypothetical protein A3E28_00855 [Candidatus Doudnabacteria bacterium RIFCSPHIGHO2_12_FULL_42_22]OGE86742.1 MAG: hypothetical protein A3C49_01690 [Candidatus Doudnabacteria bacterium RIFCSPHIGHO2_02_FULL_42_25]OGE92340.1 MAG: hypothetical protein A2895_01845 [Candidatus
MFSTKLHEALASKKPFISDRMNSVGISVAFLINIIHWITLYIKIKPTEEQLLLHYNVILGADFIGRSLYLYWIPLLALVLLFVNLILAIRFYRKEKLASYFISFSSIPVQLVFFAATIVLIFVNE